MEDYRLKQLIEEQLKYDKAKFRRADSQDDHEIAKELQRQFNQEVAVENPSNLVYETKKKNIDNTKSLVDPSWELIDPTPNIHNLFIAFNQQYFWNKLLSVCVSWSKRMTTCAGICSYQPRGGMCSITLSEPLLKLRPRKDLVETLLHEMIHAFLFVTHNNRDRDGHGPEFHKHMYRINGEAGTNITVYHTFHDEVRLYKQHWWKCNGPCQHNRPFFGMVRRATNRAPGPNDRWWAEHSRNCGGTFIKVKEPEKSTKKKEGKENTKPKTTPRVNNSTKGSKIKSPPPKHKDIRNFFPVTDTSPNRNNPISSNQRKMHDNTKIQNINGFQPGQNGSLELRNQEIATPKQSIVLFNGSGHVLATSKKTLSSKDDYSAVRNRWLDKFDNDHKNSTPFKVPAAKRQKLDLVPCPVCNEQLAKGELNQHLDICLNKPSTSNSATTAVGSENLIECDICDEWIDSHELDAHKQMCIQNVSTQLDSTASRECPICKELLCGSIYDAHVAACVMKGVDDAISKANEAEETVKCLVCKKTVLKSLLNQHLDDCMSDEIFMNDDEKEQFFDDEFENSFDNSKAHHENIDTIELDDSLDDGNEGKVNDSTVTCPVCQKKVEGKLINTHLDSCLG
ncbi:DNA-dependent metalloprotease dvc-1 isoform X1 [Atheta coriaria]|uniref:DNA-dependent metalloprotease dvc-1 isoform X1 n=1 Tax=Dalotia coriaria TaxID=877792 RepID=UPI0031F383A1